MGSTSKNPPFSSSQNSSDSLNGLKFGQKIYFEDVGIAAPAKSGGGSSSGAAGKPPPAPAKKVSGGGQPPRCQVEGCLMDLRDAKAYYGRHKVCGVHSKTPKVVVNGLEQRFCQQCSRFHQLSEFDQGKRSCRRRLAGHNERRRKPSPGTLFSPPYGRLSSSIFETSKGGGGFLMDFSTYPKLTASDTWPTSRPNHPTPMAQMVHSTTANNPSFPQGANNPSFAQGGTRYPAMVGPTIPSGECFTGGLNSGCALSLLSNQTQWVPQEMAHMVHSTMATTIATHANHQFDQHEMPRQHLGASHEDMPCQHMSQHGDDHYVGSTQQHVQYVELEHSRAFDSSTQFMNWSL